jgi:signal transduction histidine kinase
LLRGVERSEHSIAPGIEIEADRALMRQAFRNLLSNAAQYNRPAGSVTMGLRREADRAIFSISNTGPGILPAPKRASHSPPARGWPRAPRCSP